MTNARGLTYGIAIGAGLMFLFDPGAGARRRAIFRQKASRTVHEVEAATEMGMRDLEHRTEGLVARLSRRRTREVSDDVLVARIRAELGRVCSHPRAIQVRSKGNGRVELVGTILREEVQHVLDAIDRVSGVEVIEDALEIHDAPGHHPALQGGTIRPERTLFRSPAARMTVGLAGGVMSLLALLKGNPLGLVAGGAVLVGAARSIAHRGGHRRRARPALPRVRPVEPEVQPLREAYPAGSDWSPAAPLG